MRGILSAKLSCNGKWKMENQKVVHYPLSIKSHTVSRIGKKAITIPAGVEVNFSLAPVSRIEVKVKGPKGELISLFPNTILFKKTEKEIKVAPSPRFLKQNALWGTARAIVFNMIKGVTEGFEKKLELQGTGYKVNLQGKKLILDVGYSRSIEFAIPSEVEVEVEKNIITVKGIDKQLVGETAARIRKIRKVEPYKGKGLRYVGEFVRRKEGKKVVGESS